MSVTVHYVGIDVAKEWLDVHIVPSGANWRVGNDADGHRLLIDRLAQLAVGRIVLEASGGYERKVVLALGAAELSADVINPLQTRAFARACGRHVKTDKIDAACLADFAARVPAHTSIRRNPDTDQLGQTLCYRRQIQNQIAMLENQLAHFTDPAIRRRLQQRCRVLVNELKALDVRLRTLVRATDRLAQLFDKLIAVQGVGLQVACSIIVDLPELGSLDRRQIAAIVGVAPIANESGKWKGGRHIQGGRSALRNVLYMATLVAMTKNPPIRDAYKHLRDKGKPFKLAATACMRKLIVAINAMVRDNTSWNTA